VDEISLNAIESSVIPRNEGALRSCRKRKSSQLHEVKSKADRYIKNPFARAFWEQIQASEDDYEMNAAEFYGALESYLVTDVHLDRDQVTREALVERIKVNDQAGSTISMSQWNTATADLQSPNDISCLKGLVVNASASPQHPVATHPEPKAASNNHANPEPAAKRQKTNEFVHLTHPAASAPVGKYASAASRASICPNPRPPGSSWCMSGATTPLRDPSLGVPRPGPVSKNLSIMDTPDGLFIPELRNLKLAMERSARPLSSVRGRVDTSAMEVSKLPPSPGPTQTYQLRAAQSLPPPPPRDRMQMDRRAIVNELSSPHRSPDVERMDTSMMEFPELPPSPGPTQTDQLRSAQSLHPPPQDRMQMDPHAIEPSSPHRSPDLERADTSTMDTSEHPFSPDLMQMDSHAMEPSAPPPSDRMQMDLRAIEPSSPQRSPDLERADTSTMDRSEHPYSPDLIQMDSHAMEPSAPPPSDRMQMDPRVIEPSSPRHSLDLEGVDTSTMERSEQASSSDPVQMASRRRAIPQTTRRLSAGVARLLTPAPAAATVGIKSLSYFPRISKLANFGWDNHSRKLE
jgi:hypothetical protein